jgi:hypothetical protein
VGSTREWVPNGQLAAGLASLRKEVRGGARYFYYDFFGGFGVLEGIEITRSS